MFTLGNKELVVNSTRKPFSSITGDVWSIKGFGDFDTNNKTVLVEQSFIPALFAGGLFASPSAAQLGVVTSAKNVPVSFKMNMLSSRYGAAESRDFIEFGEPIVIEFFIDWDFNARSVMVALEGAMSAYEVDFKTSDNPSGSLPFTWGEAQGTTDYHLWLAAKAGHWGFGSFVTFTANRLSPLEMTLHPIDGSSTSLSGAQSNPLVITALNTGSTITELVVNSGQLLVAGSVIVLGEDSTITADLTGGALAGTDINLSANPTGKFEVGDTIILNGKDYIVTAINAVAPTMQVSDDVPVGTASDIIGILTNPVTVTGIRPHATSGTYKLLTIFPALASAPAAGTYLLLVFSGGIMGTEANVDGKYLEENVRMDTKYTNDAYAISPDERPLIGVPYLTLSWESTAPVAGPGRWSGHKRLQVASVDTETGTQKMKYTLYLNQLAFGSIEDNEGFTEGNLLEQYLDWKQLTIK